MYILWNKSVLIYLGNVKKMIKKSGKYNRANQTATQQLPEQLLKRNLQDVRFRNCYS